MKCLMVVDMQRCFIRDTNKYLIDEVNRLIHSGLFDKIIYTQFIGDNNSGFVKISNWHGGQTKEEIEIVVDIIPNSIVLKQQATYGLPPKDFVTLREEGIEEVYICGTDIDACVYAICLNLYDNCFKPIIVTDACDTSSSNLTIKQNTLEIMRRNFGPTCMCSSTEIYNELYKELSTSPTYKAWVDHKQKYKHLKPGKSQLETGEYLKPASDEEIAHTKRQTLNTENELD